MNIELIKSKREMYQQKLNDTKIEIEKAKAINESRQSIIDKQVEVDCLYTEITEYRNKLSVLKSRIIKENDEFRSRRLQHLNEVITDGVADVFPEKKLKAEVLCNFKRKDKIKLQLTDETGHVILPHIGKGKLMQYLISFSAVCGIAESLGVKNVYIDEAFGVASQNNLSIIGDIIARKISEGGMQMILVSQNPSLYQDVPRKQFNLLLDLKTGNANIDSEEIIDEIKPH